MNSPDVWKWLWFVAAIALGIGEMLTATLFLFLPFAIGAAIASGFSFLGGDVGLSWVIFVLSAGVAFAGLFPLGHRLRQVDASQDEIGSDRWVGQSAIVTKPIQPGHQGEVRVERETWRAESRSYEVLDVNEVVTIVDLRGNRLLVSPTHASAEPTAEHTFEPSDTEDTADPKNPQPPSSGSSST